MIIYWVYKLYLHHFDLFMACGPHHGQRDVVQFIYPVNNQPCVLFVYKTHLIGVMSLKGHPPQASPTSYSLLLSELSHFPISE